MRSPTDALREEHLELLPHVAFIRSAANDVGHASAEDLIEDVDEVIGFLTHVLLPHAELEDRVLYPAVDIAAGSREATRGMRRDHAEVARLTEQLRRVRPHVFAANTDTSIAHELRRILYGLHTIVTLHMSKEEEYLLPLLEDRLTTAEADELARAMSERGSIPLPD